MPQGPDQTTGKRGCPSSEAARRTSQGAREKAHLPSLPNGGLSTGIVEVVPVFRTCVIKGERDYYFSECDHKGERMGVQTDTCTGRSVDNWLFPWRRKQLLSWCKSPKFEELSGYLQWGREKERWCHEFVAAIMHPFVWSFPSSSQQLGCVKESRWVRCLICLFVFKWVSYRQRIVGFCFYSLQSDNLWLLIGVFRPFTS